MSELIQLRAAIVAALQTGLGANVKAVTTHGGRFDLEELKRIATATPAVFVSCLGAPRVSDVGGKPTLDARWAAYVVTKDESGAADGKRDTVGLTLATSVLRILYGGFLDEELDFAKTPEMFALENLFSPAIARTGLALHAVSWRTSVTLKDLPATLAELADLITIELSWAPAPGDAVGATDTVTLESAE